MDKINIVGSGDYEEALQKWFTPDVIPKFLGGTWEINGDPECSEFICAGGPFPSDYPVYPPEEKN